MCVLEEHGFRIDLGVTMTCAAIWTKLDGRLARGKWAGAWKQQDGPLARVMWMVTSMDQLTELEGFGKPVLYVA